MVDSPIKHPLVIGYLPHHKRAHNEESSNRSKHAIPCSMKTRSSLQMTTPFLSSHVYLGRYFHCEKCIRYRNRGAQLIEGSGYRQPIPVRPKRKDIKGELECAIHSPYTHQNCGTCMCALTLFSCFLEQTNDPSARSNLVLS